MGITSANINDLATYINNENTATGTLGETFQTAATKFETVYNACDFQRPNSPGLVSLGSLFENWNTNLNWVNGIRTALIEADNIDADGNATAPTAAITDYLENNNLDGPPSNIEIADIELAGQPPFSGMIDDPINAANGNFTDSVVDLPMPGVTREIAATRTYNSRAIHRVGLFGPGWSSLIDSRLDIDESTVTFVLPDGGGAVFTADGDGGYEPDRRRHLWLARTDDGWQVRTAVGSTWTFDPLGALQRADTSATEVHFERAAGAVVVAEVRSGRFVRYVSHPETGRVVRAEASDGRVATYRYDGEGHLVVAERPEGTLRYEVDEVGLILSITDADDVLVCRNTYDRWNRVATQVESHGRETTYHYGKDGVFRVSANDDSPPNVMVHDRRGRMTTMIDGLGHAMRLSYDVHDNLVRVVDRTGAVTRYGYDDHGNMTSRTDPDGVEVSVVYDDLDRPVEITDRAGGLHRLDYDGDQQVPSRLTQPDGVAVLVATDDASRPIAVTDGDSVTTRLEWTSDGQVAAVIDGAGNSTRIAYDSVGNPKDIEDASGAVAEWNFDLAGRVLGWVGTTGEETRTYTPGGRLVSEITANGDGWEGQIDETGELVRTTTRSGSTVVYERDTIGQVTAIRREGVRTNRYEYDPTGRVTAITDALGGRINRTYDAEGRLVAVSDARGATFGLSFDRMGRPTMVTSPSGETVSRTYHPTGALASLVDANGSAWRFDVDAVGRRIATHDPLGNVTRFEYTPGGRLRRSISPLGRVTEYDYDEAGRCRTIRYPDQVTVEIDRLPDGEIASVRRITGDTVATTVLGYAPSGRLSSLHHEAGALDVTEQGGEVATMTRGGATSRFERDPGGMLARVVDPAGVETLFTHDAHRRLTENRTGGSTTRYDYDPADRTRSIIDAYGQVTDFRRDERGGVVGVSHADGTEVRYLIGLNGSIEALYDGDDDLLLGFDRDPNGRITSIRGEAGVTTLSLDARGMIGAVSSPAGTVDYDWDADGRCTGWSDHTGFGVHIDHDELGQPGYRLPDRVVDAPAAPARTVDEHGRIAVDEDGRRYSYDGAGRLAAAMIGGATYRFAYDEAGRLGSEETPAGEVTFDYGTSGELLARRSAAGETRYTYDARGRRVAESGPDGSVAYRWDALGRLRGYTATATDGTVTERTLRYSTATRPCRIDDVAILWDTGRNGDLLGIGDDRFLWHGADVLIASDPDGDWSRRLTDDPWGDDGATGIRLGYRGALAFDGYLLLGDRVYDPTTRQFLSRDPLAPVPGRVDFAAPYGYCYSDPVNFVDPTGRKPLSDEEFELSRQGWGVRGYHATVDFVQENWKEILIVAGSVVLGAVLTPFVGPVFAGAIAGAVGNGLITAVNGGSFTDVVRSAAIGGITGALGGGLGKLATAGKLPGLAPSTAQRVVPRVTQNALKEGTLAFPGAVAGEGLDTYLPGGDPNDPGFEWNNVTTAVVGSAVGGAGAKELERAFIPDFDDLEIRITDDDLPGPVIRPDTTPDTAPTTPSPSPPVSRNDLIGIKGISANRADAILDYIDANGMPDKLTDLPQIGPERATQLEALL